MRKLIYLIFLLLFPLPLAAEEKPESGEQLLAAADQIAEDVAKIRGLAIKKKIKRGIKKRDELRATLLVKLAEEVTDAQLEGEANVLKAFGVIPQDTNYKKVLLDVLTEQVAGFYDQKEKELYVMQGIPLSLQRPAMAHELFHAIQDQHFDILEMQKPFNSTENADFAFARSALIEGDATVLMMDYQMGASLQGRSVADLSVVAEMLDKFNFASLSAMEQMMGGAPNPDQPALKDSALATAPLVFKESLIFPYFGGMRFIMKVKEGRTWEEFNAVYTNPPISTEQILHPEKYFAQEEPVILSYDAASQLKGYKKIFDSVWGEFEWKLYFMSHSQGETTATKATTSDIKVEEGTADQPWQKRQPKDGPVVIETTQSGTINGTIAHTGWGGDRVIGFQKGKDVVAIATTVLDTVGDAEEFYDSVLAVLKKRYPNATIQPETGKHGESNCFLVDGKRSYVERWGDVVMLIEGAPSKMVDGKETDGTLYSLRGSIWNSFKRRPFREVYDERMKALDAEEKKAPTKKKK